MKMKHSVHDTDTHFSIDPITRVLKNEGCLKNILIQGDHNSERFTFALPRRIEEHDLSQCDQVQVHYNNIDATTKVESRGVYTVDDLQISPDGDDVVICSWLISGNATKYVGALGFLLRFTCIGEDGAVSYVWQTAIHNKITVSDGLYNGEIVAEEYADILNGWKRDLEANQIISLKQTKVATEDDGINTWTVTMGDGRTYSFDVRNGSRGPKSLVGSIETVKGTPLHFFVGTQEEYDALPEYTKKNNLFAIISDDPTGENIQKFIEGVTNGTISVGRADVATNAVWAEHAERATMAGAVSNDAILVTIPKGQRSVRPEGLYLERGATYSISMRSQNAFGTGFHCGHSYLLHIPTTLVQGTDQYNSVHSTACVITRYDTEGGHIEMSYIDWSPGRDQLKDYGGDDFAVVFRNMNDGMNELSRNHEARTLEIRKIATNQSV